MKNAARIPVGQWVFFPQFMAAQNIHNGTIAYFDQASDGSWRITAASVPAGWMLTELAEWFGKWIKGIA